MFTLHCVANYICCKKKSGPCLLVNFNLLLNSQNNTWCSPLDEIYMYVYVLNVFLARKDSAVLHGYMIVFSQSGFLQEFM